MTTAKHRTPSRYVIAQFTNNQVISACALDTDKWTSIPKPSDQTVEITLSGRVMAVRETDLRQVREIKQQMQEPNLIDSPNIDPDGFEYETDLTSYYGD